MNAAPSSAKLTPRSRATWLLATFFGVGHLRPGSGTWASAITAALWLLCARYATSEWLPAGTALAAALVTAAGIPISATVARESGLADPGFVVIDEVAGQLLSLIALPGRWQYALVSFILFRGFDILKPAPLRQLEKLPGGWGIMLDDVGAGLYALAIAHLWILLAHGR